MVDSVSSSPREAVDLEAMAASARTFRGSVSRDGPEGFLDLTIVVRCFDVVSEVLMCLFV